MFVCRRRVCLFRSVCNPVQLKKNNKKSPSNAAHPRPAYSCCRPVSVWAHREQKYLWTGKAASPARAMPRLSPTLAAAIANSLDLSSVSLLMK